MVLLLTFDNADVFYVLHTRTRHSFQSLLLLQKDTSPHGRKKATSERSNLSDENFIITTTYIQNFLGFYLFVLI